ncbi:MAG: YbaB/EbfC family nucleoid-associated protein [Gammaproteobacteria bacterium]|nr:YbaB/EbfC family nucleoid-associated protein [Gammaproteobacteria bacterium]
MKDLQRLIQLGQQMQSRVTELQDNLDRHELSASSGGGMVTAVVDGKGTVRSITIEPSAVDPGDVEMLEDLVLAALAEAQNKARQHYEGEMKKMTGGFPMPGQLPKLF